MMLVATNEIETDPYRLTFEALYREHSTYWAQLHTQQSKQPSPRIRIGTILADQYTGNLDFDAFSHYIATIARATHIIPYTVTSAVVMDDPVAGCHAWLPMDSFATSKLEKLHHTLFSGGLGEDMYLERASFVAGESLGWIRHFKEASRIVTEINNLSIHITGQIDSLVVFHPDPKSSESRTFKFAQD